MAHAPSAASVFVCPSGAGPDVSLACFTAETAGSPAAQAHIAQLADPIFTPAELAAHLAVPGTQLWLALQPAAATTPAPPVAHQPALGHLLCRQCYEDIEILSLFTTPAVRRRGVARQLLRAMAQAGSAAGSTRVVLEVRASNHAAQALYASLGGHSAGRRAGYYPPAEGQIGREDAALLHLPLPF